MNLIARFVLVGAALAGAACGRPFDIKTGAAFAELPGQEPVGYDYRAITPEGVAVSVRAVKNEGGADLAFWIKAVTLKLREQDGYALVGEDAVKDAHGWPGKRLRFARDEDKKAFDYRVTLYVAQGRVFLVEAGGPREEMTRAAATVAAMETSVAVRCPSVLSPVLASRTCNRW